MIEELGFLEDFEQAPTPFKRPYLISAYPLASKSYLAPWALIRSFTVCCQMVFNIVSCLPNIYILYYHYEVLSLDDMFYSR